MCIFVFPESPGGSLPGFRVPAPVKWPEGEGIATHRGTVSHFGRRSYVIERDLSLQCSRRCRRQHGFRAGCGSSGTIYGTISDSTGAVLPNVKITVTNTGTNAAFNTESNSAGDFNAPSLQPGTYRVSAEAPGFQKAVTDAFTLAVDQKIRIPLSLKPGAVTETLQVAAQAVNLNTDDAALSQEISGDEVANLPLNGRNFMQLMLISAGAVTVGGEQGTMRQGEGNAISVNGGRPEGNNYTLDGLVNTDQAMMTPAVILFQDAIGEFKIQSGIYPAENGFGASQVNIVSKGDKFPPRRHLRVEPQQCVR